MWHFRAVASAATNPPHFVASATPRWLPPTTTGVMLPSSCIGWKFPPPSLKIVSYRVAQAPRFPLPNSLQPGRLIVIQGMGGRARRRIDRISLARGRNPSRRSRAQFGTGAPLLLQTEKVIVDSKFDNTPTNNTDLRALAERQSVLFRPRRRLMATSVFDVLRIGVTVITADQSPHGAGNTTEIRRKRKRTDPEQIALCVGRVNNLRRGAIWA